MLAWVTGLVVFALAFPAGWLVCRAWLAAASPATPDDDAETVPKERLHALLRAQRSRYRRRVQLIHDVVKRHERTRDQIRDKLALLQKEMEASSATAAGHAATLAEREAELDALRARIAELETAPPPAAAEPPAPEALHEIGLLRIERDELSARLRRLEPPPRPAEAPATDTGQLAELRASLGEAREALAARDHRLRDLERRLADRDAQVAELAAELQSWKHRVAPLARQVQVQRELIRRHHATLADAQPAADDLKRIRGIGPGLERRLHAEGIFRFEQLAGLSPAEATRLAERLGVSGALPARDHWVEQSAALAAEAAGAAA